MTQTETVYKMLADIRALAFEAAPRGKALRIVNRADRISATLKRMERRDKHLTLTRRQAHKPGISTGAEVRAAYDKRATDRQRILDILQTPGGSLTTAQAIDMGILRAGARVYELRQKGFNIQTEMIKSGADRIAKYTLNS